jgi:hypothetical protein
LFRLVFLVYDLVDDWLLIVCIYEFIMPGVVLILLYVDISCLAVQVVVDEALQLEPLPGLSGIFYFLLGQHVQPLQMMVLQDYLGNLLEKLQLSK